MISICHLIDYQIYIYIAEPKMYNYLVFNKRDLLDKSFVGLPTVVRFPQHQGRPELAVVDGCDTYDVQSLPL